MKKQLIALTGYKGCGKNFFYDNFLKYYTLKNGKTTIQFKNFAFADILKEYCCELYGFTLDEIEKYKRDYSKKFKVGHNKFTMREILVNTANNLRKLSNDSIWAELTLKSIEKHIEKNSEENIVIPVITDLRFLTEVNFLRKNFNTSIFYIENNCKECQDNKFNKDEIEIKQIKTEVDFKLECLKSVKDFNEIIDRYREKIQNAINAIIKTKENKWKN